MSYHDENGGAETHHASGRFVQKNRPVSELRHRARRAASRFFAVAVASSSVATVARTLGVSERQINRWMDPDHAAAITLGDVLALPVAQCNQLLDMCRAHRERDYAHSHEDPARRQAAILAAAAQAVLSTDPRAKAKALRALEDAAARAAVDLAPDSTRTPTKE